MNNWSPAARRFLIGVTTAGGAALVLSILGLPGEVAGAGPAWLLLLATALVFGLFALEVPGHRVVVTPTETVSFLAVLLCGPGVAAIIGAVEGFTAARRARSGHLYSAVFSSTGLGLSLFVAGHVYILAGGRPIPASGSFVLDSIVLPILIMAAVHHLLNTGLVATMIHLRETAPPPLVRFWWSEYGFAFVTYLSSASLAALVALVAHRFGWSAVLAALPLLMGILYINRLHAGSRRASQRHREEMQEAYRRTLFAVASAIDAKDELTRGHVYRVRMIGTELAGALGLAEELQDAIGVAGLLHDIGKLAIPDTILNKRGPLTHEEYRQVQTHAELGARLLADIRFPGPVLPAVRHHHEAWDGSGYPSGLSGEAIPQAARVLAVADQYDAMRSNRPFRPGLTAVQALEVIQNEAGRRYDPQVVAALSRILDRLEGQLARSGEWARESGDGEGVLEVIARSQRQNRLMYEALLELGSSLDLGETCESLARHMREIFPEATGVVYLASADGARLDAAHAWGPGRDALLGLRLARGTGVAGTVLAGSQAVLNADPRLDLVGVNPAVGSGFHSAAGFPLADAAGRIEAVAAIYSPHQGAFDAGQAGWMAGVSRKACEAIRNARVFGKVQETVSTDHVTELPSGESVSSRLARLLDRAGGEYRSFSVMTIALRGLDEVEARTGHEGRLRLVREIAQQIRRQVPPGDFLGRGEGDRFVLLCDGRDRREAERLACRIEEEVGALRCVLDSGRIAGAEAAAGVAVFPADGATPGPLLDCSRQRADGRPRRDASRSGGIVNLRLIGTGSDSMRGGDGLL